MQRRVWIERIVSLTLLILGAAVGGCGHKNQYQLEKEWQEQQAKHLKPIELDTGGDTGWKRFSVLKIRVYSDAAFRARVGSLRSYFADWLARVNEVTNPSLQLRLEVEDFRELPESASSDNLDSVLDALRALDPGDDVDFVLALVGKSPILTLSFHDLGRAGLLGKHLVVRAMDDAAELQALSEGLDKIDAAERARLYTQRKRHKETAVLLHEIAHTLGALHTTATDDLMHPSYHASMASFAEPNVHLMRYALDERTTDVEDRDPEAFVKRIETYLSQSDWQGWIEDERVSHLGALHEVIEQVQARAASVTAAPQPKAAAPAVDLSALAEADRALYLALDVQNREGKWTEAFEVVSDLAERYPASLPVQQKACELGMQFGVSLVHIKPYCDRMNSLLMAGPAERR